MSEKNTGGPAFPGIHEWQEPDIGDPDTGETLTYIGRSAHVDGMTLRDYFAAQMMPVILQMAMEGSVTKIDGTMMTPSDYAKAAYENADAMIAEREK